MLLILGSAFYKVRVFPAVLTQTVYLFICLTHVIVEEELELLANFRKDCTLSDIMITHLLVIEFLHADGWTDGETWLT
jgi:hypothetical protein